MVAPPPKPKDHPFPEELVVFGSDLQTALRSGGDVPQALSAFCAAAFTRRDLALPGASFLLSTFVKDIKHLGNLMGPRHLADELAAGSSALCSLVSAYWDRKGEIQRLVELADEILSRGRPASPLESQLAEFIAALAAALAIPHPERAQTLLGLIEGSPFTREDPHFLEEVQEWQRAGQMLSHSTEAERSFWQQEVRRRRRNWFWDTEEGRSAIRKLEESNPSAIGGGSLIHRVVPNWAWERNEPDAAPMKNARPPETPQEETAPASSAIKPESESRLPAIIPTRKKAGMLQAVMVGAGGIFLLAAGMSLLDSPDSGPAPNQTTDYAFARDGETSADPVKEKAEAKVPPALSLASQTEPLVAAAPELKPAAEEPPVQAAQLVPVEVTTRIGWVRSPLGLEFQVTEANAFSGKLTDPDGRPWKLPSDPSLVAEITGELEAINPYTGEKTLITNDRWVAGETIAWGETGWSFKLPDPLPVAVVESASTQTDIASAESPAPAESTSLVAAKESKTPGSQAPARGKATASTSGKTKQKTAGSVKTTSAESGQTTDFYDGDLASLEARLHPDYGRARAKPSSRPVLAAPARASTAPPTPAPEASTAAQKPERPSFVTRANSIRMTYKQGYWESRPGAYLSGSATTPERWAHDMTLRERSSGTIPPGYVFAVAGDGTVRIVPDGSRQ